MDPIVEARKQAYMTAPASRALTDAEQSVLKREINNLIWMYSPAELTLEAADKLACDILAKIVEGT